LHPGFADPTAPMKTKINLIAVSMLATLFLAGCCSTDNVAKPSNITLVNALRDVGTGLAEMKAAELATFATNKVLNPSGTNDFFTGLFPAEVDVTFNVTAGASNGNQLSLDLNASAPSVPVGGKISDTYSTSSTASRGNQITVKFMSAYFTTTTTTTTATNGIKVVVEQKLTDATALNNFLNVIKGQHAVEYFNKR
jgi:outer membrane murein-binding lipoprotein Lpp